MRCGIQGLVWGLRFVPAGLLAWVFLGLAPVDAHAQHVIPYRGNVALNGAGVNGPVSLTFEVFNQQADGTRLAGPFTYQVDVQDGEFSVEIGPVSQAVVDAPSLFIAASVGPPGGPATLLGQRQKVGAAVYARRGAPGTVFKADALSVTPATGPATTINNTGLTVAPSGPGVTTSIGQSGLAVGTLSVGSGGIVTAPALRADQALNDQQGLVSGSRSFVFGTACPNGRANCYFFDVPFQSHNGTVFFQAEATGWRHASGLGELFLVLDPNASGSGTNAGVMRLFFSEANSHLGLPSFMGVFPTASLQCASPPCNHVLRIIPRTNNGAEPKPGQLNVDQNDFAKVTVWELPMVTTN